VEYFAATQGSILILSANNFSPCVAVVWLERVLFSSCSRILFHGRHQMRAVWRPVNVMVLLVLTIVVDNGGGKNADMAVAVNWGGGGMLGFCYICFMN